MTGELLTIPQVRVQLLALADRLDNGGHVSGEQIRELEKQLYRRKIIRRAPNLHKNPDRPTTKMIREYVIAHPEEGYAEVAAHFDVTIGRVSEAMIGKRGGAKIA